MAEIVGGPGRERPDNPDEPEERKDAEEDGGERPAVAPWRWILAGALALFLAGSATLWFRCGLHGCPDVETLRGYMPDEASVVLDRDGEEISKLFLTRRIMVPLDSLSEHVPAAFVAIEDKRFWEHGGVDWRRVAGAMATNIKSMGVEEGSSTITMQLARNVFPEKLPANQRTMWRKLGEARVARLIEQEYTKEDILQLYLNQIYFGNGAYGIEAAAQEYFGKPAAELDLSEAALLAALPRAPSRLNPRSNPEAALEGRALVLERMTAQGLITAEEAAEAGEVELELREGQLDDGGEAPYFVEAVRRRLEDELGDAIYTGGYTIHTTLDLAMQKAAEAELTEQMRAIESGRYGSYRHETWNSVHGDSTADLSGGTPYVQAALIVLDARTGDVLTLIGGRDYDDSEFNRATQARRQPGSAFKPFVYAAALASGYPPSHQVADEPIRMVLDGGRTWEPKNYDGSYSGAVSLREGLMRSKNVVTVRIANEIGLGRVVSTAEQMLGQSVPSNPSVVLGTAEVTPLGLTAAYAAFATLGRRPEPRFVLRVEDRNGGIVWTEQPYATEVIQPAAAYLTTNILEDVVDRGTGTAVRAVGFRGAAGGKTGTTQDAADVWFVGFTPEVVGTIWIGFDERKTVVRGATGGELAAPVWGRLMRRIDLESAGWEPPPGVETRTVNGQGEVIADNCAYGGETRTEYFLSGTAPLGTCYPDYYAYGDSLGYGSYYGDTLRVDTLDGEDGWWDRMRARLRSLRNGSDTTRIDSAGRPPVRIDTTRSRSDTLRGTDPTRRDSVPPIRPVRVDTATVRRDTIRPGSDTTIRRPPPDTTRRPPPDTTRRPPPDTTRRPPPDTTRRPPPDTTRRPPPDTTRRPPPDTTRRPPADAMGSER
jgi:1A family penicillin-binding protein